jgi:hypothetical protein
LVGLSQVDPFNDWNAEREAAVSSLIAGLPPEKWSSLK